MVEICKGFKINLLIKDNWAEIRSYEHLLILPEEIKFIKLPYFIPEFKSINSECQLKNNFKYISFELEDNLILKGLQCLKTNLNEKSRKTNLSFFFKNSNVKCQDSILGHIIGSENKIVIKSGTVLGKVYFNI